MPIVYVGLGALGYSTYINNKNARSYTNAIVYRNANGVVDTQYPDLTISQLRANRDYYLSNRDVSIIALLAFYGLQIVDAAVDAHLYQFNVNKSLSINFMDTNPAMNIAGASFVYRF